MSRYNPLTFLWKVVRRQLSFFVMFFIGMVILMSYVYNDARTVNLAGTAVIAIIFVTASTMQGCWMLFGRRDPEALAAMKYPVPKKHHKPLSVDIILCAVNEPDVIYDTIRDLALQDHPYVKVIISLIESDDTMDDAKREGNDRTIAVAYQAKREFGDRIEVLVLPYKDKKKPYQLNEALNRLCTGDIVGVIDAEDATHPKLISAVEAAFHENDVDIVQGAVQLMNLGIDKWYRWREWFCVHNVLEYYFWWSSRVMFQVRNGFVPLGGNTVFIRRGLLVRAGGWPDSPTEDCALGVKLSTQFGAKVAAYYDPEMATREETPHSIWGLIKQRVRWNTGFGMELIDKNWWALPTFRQRALAWYTLATPFIQAVTGLFLLATIASVLWLKAPVTLALLTFLPLIAVIMTMIIQIVGLQDFGHMYQQKVKMRHYIALIVGFYPYQLVLAFAAVWSVSKILQKDMSWQHNTSHKGTHRTTPALTLVPTEEAV